MKTVQKTYVAKAETVSPEWFVIDGDAEIVGRLAVRIATVLMGKHKPGYTAHVDTGDFVVVLNCDKVRFTGKSVASSENPYFTSKTMKKEYDYWTGYPGGRRIDTAAELLIRHPEKVLSEAVRRMLPKSKLGRKMLSKLKLYVGTEHPHQAQNPQPFPEYVK
ncbi:50S ribosomal protein L13 [Planctomicrobium piriforme]|uniref:Large ribosomal subunit protein uL13 n=1 Tax=Planctomicrobium piriforme TaxID=1576369 RepID=A0A1I3FJE8_9PLAN|nr:50S ribosomal protein L13 [Planctomicrobium piriforme]SFI11041.1 large subunit ribosomal protein L13 [Planctomicrobium piriforme]